MNETWMIYGANGYTGRIAAEEAKRRGLRPILAGRSPEKVEALARELELPWRAFDLTTGAEIAPHLDGVALVLHCAGPFSATSRPMLDACIQSKTHYLDITGEISVFENLFSQSDALAAAGITGISGVGFDVVPSDCLAAMLHRELPDATHLRMAMRSLGGAPSPGTTKTMVEGLAQGGCVRRDGKLTPVPTGYKTMWVPFTDGKPAFAVTIPWGDVSTAYHSTGIPNIEFYMGIPPSAIRGMRAMGKLQWLAGRKPVQAGLKKLVELFVHGPDAEARAKGRTVLWGEVENASGAKMAMRMATPEGYTFTVDASLACVERVLAGGVRTGAATPSMAFGADFVLSLGGVERQLLESTPT